MPDDFFFPTGEKRCTETGCKVNEKLFLSFHLFHLTIIYFTILRLAKRHNILLFIKFIFIQ